MFYHSFNLLRSFKFMTDSYSDNYKKVITIHKYDTSNSKLLESFQIAIEI